MFLFNGERNLPLKVVQRKQRELILHITKRDDQV